MKILLLEHPRTISPGRCNDIANTPLSSCLLSGYAAALLKSRGHQAEILEGYLDKLSYEEIGRRIRDQKPDILGVHMVYQWRDDTELFTFLDGVKRDGPPPFIAAYGYYPTFSFDEILSRSPSVDAVIAGEPEETFAQLARELSQGSPPAGLPGVAMRSGGGKTRLVLRKPLADLDSLPFPERTEALMRLPEVNLMGSRGCYGSCTFCYINPFHGGGPLWRGRSPENIAAEICHLISKYGRKEFYFTDPNFFGPGQKGQDRALRLASLLKPLRIHFGIEARVNDIRHEIISALAEAGLGHILIGLESGLDSSLRRMNKMTTVEQNEKAIAILRKNGIEPNVGFIMFDPDSSLEDVRANFEFLRRNNLLKNLPVTANVLYHHQIILRGTPAYRRLQSSGRLETPHPRAYEGAAAFSHGNVAALAAIMRDITAFLFSRMAGIRDGKGDGGLDCSREQAIINDLLVEWFEELLTALEAGEQPTDGFVNSFVRKAQEKIMEIENKSFHKFVEKH